MSRNHMQRLIEKHGELPERSVYGYPMYYENKAVDILCPACANAATLEESLPVVDHINWDDIDLRCDLCGARIPSDADDEEIERDYED